MSGLLIKLVFKKMTKFTIKCSNCTSYYSFVGTKEIIWEISNEFARL